MCKPQNSYKFDQNVYSPEELTAAWGVCCDDEPAAVDELAADRLADLLDIFALTLFSEIFFLNCWFLTTA